MSSSHIPDSDFDEIIDEAARTWLREHETQVSDHPGIETLIAFQESDLQGSQAESVSEHVAHCADCLEELKALERFDQAEPEHDTVDEVEHRRGWRAFVRRRERSPKRTMFGPQHAVIAASVLAVVGLGSLMLSLGPGTSDSTPFVVDLLPDGTSFERGAGGKADIRLPPGVDTFVPRLNFGDQIPYEAYELQLTDANGERVLHQRVEVRDPQGRIALLISRHRLADGRYRITLAGLRESERTTIAVYSFRLRDAD